MDLATDQLAVLPATQEAYHILYQDADLLIVNKPCRLLTVPGRHPANHDCLISRVQREFPTAQVVHRLDYDTSGIVVLPLNKASLSTISKQFQARTIQKCYQARVFGQLDNAGEVNLAIAADPAAGPRYKICPEQGKAALTYYQLLAYRESDNTSLVELRPVTGRSHQLRLHMHAIGHPILGDSFYAPPAIQAMAERLMLHAGQICLQHPKQAKTITVSCPSLF